MPDVAMLERQDLALFVNAACACTGQSEFYGASAEQRISLGFLHDYVFGNYRRLYGLCLAAGINHFNQAEIVARLLAAGAPRDPLRRREEARLIRGVLAELPPQRVYRLFDSLRRAQVNNRRTRATIAAWLSSRRLTFDALKYRGHLRSAARHAHLSLGAMDGSGDELHAFLFDGPHAQPAWEAPLLEAFRRARYDQRAIYALPFSVAEGLAQAHGIPRKRFLERIAPQMTSAERARVEDRARREGAELDPLQLDRLPLTRLCTLLLSRPFAQRRSEAEHWRGALAAAGRRALEGAPPLPARVRAVLDASHSARGGAQKRNRPLAIALGASQLLAQGAADYRAHWTHPVDDELLLRPRGQTDLASGLLDALEDAPELVVIVSDGFENDPPGAAAEVARLYRERVDPRGATAIVHVNPVFDATAYMPRPLGPGVATIGIHAAEELPLKLAFAQFTVGRAPLSELESWLEARAARWLEAP